MAEPCIVSSLGPGRANLVTAPPGVTPLGRGIPDSQAWLWEEIKEGKAALWVEQGCSLTLEVGKHLSGH